MIYDVVIVGGGPGGLSAALALGRARKRVLLCDSGPRRNAAAVHIHNFVTRDGTPPDEFRTIARAQLAPYANVDARDVRVVSISGTRGAFRVELPAATIEARRILLCTGMIDDMLEIDGFRELWGSAIFQCPYCHGWEIKDRRWGYLGRAEDADHLLPFTLMLRGWTRELTVFTNGAVEIAEAAQAQLRQAGVHIETAAIARLAINNNQLAGVELTNGTTIPCEFLFAHPPQRQVELVRRLGVALDEKGFVNIDAMKRETSIPGVYAGGDLITRMQGAVQAAAAGALAAAMINMELTAELALSGSLSPSPK